VFVELAGPDHLTDETAETGEGGDEVARRG